MGLLKNIFTLGGAYRLEKARGRYEGGIREYERLVHSLASSNAEIECTVEKLKKSFGQTKRTLILANKMLAPCGLDESRRPTVGDSVAGSGTMTLYGRAREAFHSASSGQLIVSGAAVGTSTALLAWQGAQIVGIASTGTAMLGLHGAAASNAGWALFGGGSLATGGGGMALGHLLLPGIGIAVAIGFSAVTTHSQANELNAECDRVDVANDQNRSTLAKVDSDLARLLKSKYIYDLADAQFCAAVGVARRRLRRFGYLSVLFRFVRFKINGTYYTPAEESWADELDDAVRAFMSKIGVTAR